MEEKNDEMRCPQPDMNANECHVQERHIADTTKTGSIFPHHFWRVPQLFFITSSKGIAYACTVSLSFGQIQHSTFYDP